MDGRITLAVVRQVIQRVPLLLKTMTLNLLRMSPTAGKQDLKTELTVEFIRSLINFTEPPLEMQRRSMRDPGKKGYMWVSQVKMPKPPENDVLQALQKAMEHHMEGSETYAVPEVGAVEAEWTGYRKEATAKTPEPEISEEAKYERLMEDVDEDVTILYFHGGAYQYGPALDPSCGLCANGYPIA